MGGRPAWRAPTADPVAVAVMSRDREAHRAPTGSLQIRPRPRKRFGQHFLADVWAEKVVRAIDPTPGDVFLEIGPGTGALTMRLATSGVPILAVEIDRD